MRKKQSLLLAVLICAFSILSFAQIPCENLPPKPSPKRAVNDLANVMNQDTKDSLETALNDYYKSTSISIVVATVPTIGDYSIEDYGTYLFRCWGIGDAATNQGLLVLVSVNDHHARVCTGTGMEGFIPDLDAAKSANLMPPFFKEGNFTGGIVACVRDLVKDAGHMTWDDRLLALQKKKEANERRKAEITATIMDILFITALIVLLVALFFYIRYRVRIAREKKLIRAAMADLDKEITTAEQMVKDTYAATRTAPQWVQEEAKMHQVLVMDSISEARKELQTLKDHKSIDNNSAKFNLHEISALLQKASGGYRKLENDLRKKMLAVDAEAPKRLKDAICILVSNMGILSGYIKKGYRFNDVFLQLEEYKEVLDSYEQQLNDRESLLTIYTKSFEIAQKSDDMVKKVRETVVTAQSVAKGLTEAEAEAKRLYEMKDTIESRLVAYKSKYPASAWEEQEATFYHALKRLEPSLVQQKVAAITHANNMEQQDFVLAKKDFDSFLEIIGVLAKAIKDIEAVDEMQMLSKQHFKETYATVKETVADALLKTKDNDVSKKTKEAAKLASKRLQEAKTDSGLTLVDWVILWNLLTTIDEDAKNASSQAATEISVAQSRRVSNSYSKAYISADDPIVTNTNFGNYQSDFDPGGTSGGGMEFGGMGGGDTQGGGASVSW